MFNNIVILILLSIPLLIHSEVIDHLKPALNKEGDHSIHNVDFIYMINLDTRPEKFERSIQELQPFGIEPCRFSAVNGWELPLDVLNELGVKYESWMKQGLCTTYFKCDGIPYHEVVQVPGRCYYGYCFSRGAIGIVLSHLSVLKDALDSGYETIWVMEDDIDVIQNPHLISSLIEKLDSQVGKDNWDVLFTDRDTKNKEGKYVPCYGFPQRPNFDPVQPERFYLRKNISKEFRQVGARFGAYSMIIRRSGMEKILSFINTYKVFNAYDIDFYAPEKIKMYTVREDVVSTFIDALSDNRASN